MEMRIVVFHVQGAVLKELNKQGMGPHSGNKTPLSYHHPRPVAFSHSGTKKHKPSSEHQRHIPGAGKT